MHLKDKKKKVIKDVNTTSPELVDFEEACYGISAEISESPEEKVNDTIFHYTKSETLIEILKSRTLWMSDYKFLNDKNGDKEITYAIDVLNKIINDLVTSGKEKQFMRILLKKLPRIKEKAEIFICSFCLKSDHAPAWEEYAQKCKGVSIGFAKEAFIPLSDVGSKDMVLGQRVHYSTDCFRQYMTKITCLASEKIQELRYNHKLSVVLSDEISSIMIAYLLSWLPKLKRDIFTHENEYRTIRGEERWPFSSENSIQINPNDKFIRKTEYGNIDTTLFKFEHKDICEIWLGQKCDLEEVYVNEILKDNGYMNVMIYKSRV